jgi:hypothetical protein
VRRYAETTKIPLSRSLEQAKELLRKYEARRIVTGEDEDSISMGFEIGDRQIRVTIPFRVEWDQDQRRAGRLLLLILKSRLSEWSSGVDFDEVFLPYIVRPGGRTVFETMRDELRGIGKTPALPAGMAITE